MTSNTSAVAVCCSRASRVSVISRAFSIAITAWAAKFSTSAICFSVNGRTSGGRHNHAEQRLILSQRHDENRCAHRQTRPTARRGSPCR